MAILPYLMVRHLLDSEFISSILFIILYMFLEYLDDQVEQDLVLANKIEEATKREAEVMKHVDGWKVGESVFTQRWAAPTNSR